MTVTDSDRQARLVWFVLIILGTMLCIVGWSRWARGQETPRPATPVEPIAAVVDAFHSHRVVAADTGRSHDDAQGHAFFLSLVRDPRFAAVANDIVVECCNALYQPTLDAYISGDDVPVEKLQLLWRNTTQVNATQRDCVFCEDLFRAVRTVNVGLPRARQLRVLAGDPPIDWASVNSREDHSRWIAERDTFPADLIRHEVLDRGRRALVIYGGMHLQRKNLIANYASDGLAATLVSLLEDSGGTKVFSIWTAGEPAKIQESAASWPAPRLALLRGTALGAADFSAFYTFPMRRVAMRDGKPDFSTPLPREAWRTLRMEEQFDAVLYLGPLSQMTRTSALDPSMCVDTGYMQTLRERMALVNLKPEIERLNSYCAGRERQGR